MAVRNVLKRMSAIMAWQAAIKMVDVQRSCRKGTEPAEENLDVCALYAPAWTVFDVWMDALLEICSLG